MPRLRRNEIVEIDEFTIQARTYSDTELRDFHNKTQRFYKEKTRTDGSSVKILDFNELAVAFGAFSKTDAGGGRFYYRAIAKEKIVKKNRAGETYLDTEHPTRYEQLANLWSQYEDWQRKQDWIENKNVEALQETASQIPF